jgi:16S rRNA (guanine(966)-N(2))-methyltransferase RsmD
MRIIAGVHRGRRLLGPEDDRTTRPIPDRVKQSLFDRLAAAGRLDGAVVLDLFAGTGSMGIECLSRGAESVTFVERDRSAAQLLKQNLEMIGAAGQARVMPVDALGSGLVPALSGRSYTLLFVDPPYRLMERETDASRVRDQITRLAEVAAAGATLMLRVEKHTDLPAIAGWTADEPVTIGSMTLHFMRR